MFVWGYVGVTDRFILLRSGISGERGGAARLARGAHNPKVGSSNLPPATILKTRVFWGSFVSDNTGIDILNMTLVNGAKISSIMWGVGFYPSMKWRCQGASGKGAVSLGGAFIVVSGRRLWFSLIVGYLR